MKENVLFQRLGGHCKITRAALLKAAVGSMTGDEPNCNTTTVVELVTLWLTLCTAAHPIVSVLGPPCGVFVQLSAAWLPGSARPSLSTISPGATTLHTREVDAHQRIPSTPRSESFTRPNCGAYVTATINAVAFTSTPPPAAMPTPGVVNALARATGNPPPEGSRVVSTATAWADRIHRRPRMAVKIAPY